MHSQGDGERQTQPGRTRAEPPICAGIRVLPVKTRAVQMWTLCADVSPVANPRLNMKTWTCSTPSGSHSEPTQSRRQPLTCAGLASASACVPVSRAAGITGLLMSHGGTPADGWQSAARSGPPGHE
jgi:hypothetical protein